MSTPVQTSNNAMVGSMQEHPPMLLLDDSFIGEVIKRVRGARRSIWICAYTWQWFTNSPEKDLQQFNAAVSRLAQNGCDVRAIVHRTNDREKLRQNGIITRTMPDQRLMHTKAVVIDGEILILGSHNLTTRGTKENYECSLLIQNTGAVDHFVEYFEKMWHNYAK